MGGTFFPEKEMLMHADRVERGDEPAMSSAAKAAESWTEMVRGLDESVLSSMAPRAADRRRSGVDLQVPASAGFFEMKQYDWPSTEAFVAAVNEADRQLVIGALEFVPEESYEAMLEMIKSGFVHAWTVVKQGSKWRLCQNCKPLLNRWTRLYLLCFRSRLVWRRDCGRGMCRRNGI